MSIYQITNRDCGGASAGGAPDLSQYQTWITNFSRGLGSQLVVIILETDSIALLTCLNSSDLAARNQALSNAVRTLKSANPNAKVYLDGGHSTWNSASEQANRMRNAGMQYADGFYTNVSNFNSTANEANYGRAIISSLNGMGLSGKRQIIDTSRNGGASGDWCGDDNTDRRLGQYPTLNTGDSNIDGYLSGQAPGRGRRLLVPGRQLPAVAGRESRQRCRLPAEHRPAHVAGHHHHHPPTDQYDHEPVERLLLRDVPDHRFVARWVPGRGHGTGRQLRHQRLDHPVDARQRPDHHAGVERRAQHQRFRGHREEPDLQRFSGRECQHDIRLPEQRRGQHSDPDL